MITTYFVDILNYIVVSRPLSCAEHFRKNSRKKPSIDVYLIKDGSTFEDREENYKAVISIAANEDVWLHSCILTTSSSENIENVRIFSNGVMVQDNTPHLHCISASTDKISYRLYLNKPFLCEVDEKYDFCFVLDKCLKKYLLPVKCHSSVESIKIESEINHFVKSLHFTKNE